MKYDSLLRSRRIHREKVSREEIKQALLRAERDIETAGKIFDESRDWSFSIAYNAALQASRAYIFSQGYRPSSRDSHKNTFAFMKIAFGKKHGNLVSYFDRMRVKRHEAVYETAGIITDTEAENLLARAEEFVELVRKKLAVSDHK